MHCSLVNFVKHYISVLVPAAELAGHHWRGSWEWTGGWLWAVPCIVARFDVEENLQTASQVKEEAFSSFGAALSLWRLDVS